jgi:hypothetical protein
MNAQRINQIAQEIYQQVRASVPMNVLWSWGISKKQATYYKNMPSLIMVVNGFIHKGIVIISLNEGKDLYNIYLLNNQQEVIQTIEDVYSEDLDILDRLIETGEMTDTEYKGKVNSRYFDNPIINLLNSMVRQRLQIEEIN